MPVTTNGARLKVGQPVRRFEDERLIHGEIDRRRSVRVYPPGSLTTQKLREAVAVESEIAGTPSLLILEGVDLAALCL